MVTRTGATNGRNLISDIGRAGVEGPVVVEGETKVDEEENIWTKLVGGGGCSTVACLSRMTIGHASLARGGVKVRDGSKRVGEPRKGVSQLEHR